MDEFCVCRAQARIDIAVVNGSLHGYELKSDADRLDRLPAQLAHYDRVFDTVTMVVAPKHVDRTTSLVQDWHGLLVAEPGSAAPLELRPARPNPAPCLRSVVQLLWSDEMRGLLADAPGSWRRRPRRDLISAVCELGSAPHVSALVRETLKRRLLREHPI